MATKLRDIGFVTFFAATVLFTNLGGPTLWDRDEPRNAGCAQEMLARGDWVVPTFNGELRTHKPALLYWLTMGSYRIFGVNEFAARFPSALLGTGTVLLTYLLALRLFSRRIAILSGCILATTLMFDVASRAATPDSVLIFTVTLTLYLYGRSVFRRALPDGPSELVGEGVPTWGAALQMYGAMGLAVLAKGPIGLVVPTAIIGMFLLVVRFPSSHPLPVSRLWDRGKTMFYRLFVWLPAYFVKTCWLMRPITAIVTCLLVAGPWYYQVGVQTNGEWLRGFFLEHNVGRAAQAMEGHRGSLFYYPAALLAGFFPWSIFALPVVIESTRRLRQSSKHQSPKQNSSPANYVFAVCWVGVWMGVFTVASTKLPSYITPLYPGLAMLCAAYLHRWSKGESLVAASWQNWSMASLAVVGVAIAVGLPVTVNRFLPGEAWLGVMAVIPLALAVGGFVLLRAQRRDAFVALQVGGAAVFMLTMFVFVADRVSEHQRSDELVAGLAVKADGEIELASYGILEPSWVFYLREPIWELGDSDNLADDKPQDEFWSRRRSTTPQRFLSMDQRNRLITTKTNWEMLRDHLPADIAVLKDIPYFLQDERLVVVGHLASLQAESGRSEHQVAAELDASSSR